MSAIRRVRGYWPAYRAFQKLPDQYAELSGHRAMLLAGWQRALEKDETGLNCILLHQDWVERLTPMQTELEEACPRSTGTTSSKSKPTREPLAAA